MAIQLAEWWQGNVGFEHFDHMGSGFTWLASFSPDPRQTMFMSARSQAIEVFFAHFLFGALIFVTLLERRKNAPQPFRRQQLTTTGLVLRTLLTLCLLVTIVHKVVGQKVPFMLMHCHAATSCYLYSMYTRNFNRAQKVFNLAIYYSFFTLMAIFAPDTRDLLLPGEIINFWVHHVVLLVVPIYLYLSGHYQLDLSAAYNLRLAIGIGALFHYDVMLPVALYSGKNVGYMLWPPPTTLFKAPDTFRPCHGASMAVLCTVVWLVLRLVAAFSKPKPTEPASDFVSAKAKQA
eukprot:TRINITY_DN7314_c0_g1_i1.p1 TRINITY_DN7314_c0_g1~~TRINITY_DN7314_c0_g1_i1.p1  ORF type:complete len:317 (+),score=90.91 TRINITY_DN7314_c0_g1_i1:82-951(+)